MDQLATSHPSERVDVAVVGLGALGSAAVHHLARRGARVVGFEQFELGHVRGASHDTSRIVRTSYGAAQYVRLARSAYADWAELERETGERLLTPTGGLVFVPEGSPYSIDGFSTSLGAHDVPFDLLDAGQVRRRWPQFHVGDDVRAVWTADTAIAHANRTVATLQLHARVHGADLRERTPVRAITPDDTGVVVHTPTGTLHARTVVLAADAWTNRLLEPLGAGVPLVTMQEQVTYFAPADPAAYDRERFPVWIWEDEQCFYGFPTYGEPTVKAARDVSGNLVTPEERTFAHSPGLLAELQGFLGRFLPGSGPDLRTVTCQYALTPERRFVLSPLPRHPAVLVALGAGHAFKFTPVIGRVLAELALDGGTGEDLSGFGFDAPAEPAPAAGP